MGKKIKVAIVTIISYNYGNRLQNYALQETLQKLNIQVETIPIDIKYDLKGRIKLRIKVAVAPVLKKYSEVCWDLFDQNINWSKYIATDNHVDSQYDYFIAGSDQIWNPLFECNSEREFLTFTTNEKKIAYAASIGLDELPCKLTDEYKKYIGAFKMVSVREKSAADIIEKLGCTRPKVVLDPTMLLSEEEWKSVIGQSKLKINKKYVVVYFLGIRNAEFDLYTIKKAAEMETERIDIMNLPLDLKKKIGPAEFIALLYNSEAVFTDSFHGTVFSILFHKPFIVFERPYEEGYGKMSSRLDTLLETFGMNERRVSCKEQLKMLKLKCDFLEVDKILKDKRAQSIDFLKSSLNN